jgi:hypothetical protein
MNPATKYRPFKLAGLRSVSAIIRDLKLRRRSESEKVTLPIWAWMFRPESTRKFTWPALARERAAGSYFSLIRVPIFGLGIKPRGPSTFPKGLSLGSKSGVVKSISKSVLPWLISTIVYSFTNISTIPFPNFSCIVSEQYTAILTLLPNPAGMNAEPLTIWSPILGLTPNCMHISTVSRKLVKECTRRSWRAWYGLYWMVRSWIVKSF